MRGRNNEEVVLLLLLGAPSAADAHGFSSFYMHYSLDLIQQTSRLKGVQQKSVSPETKVVYWQSLIGLHCLGLG